MSFFRRYHLVVESQPFPEHALLVQKAPAVFLPPGISVAEDGIFPAPSYSICCYWANRVPNNPVFTYLHVHVIKGYKGNSSILNLFAFAYLILLSDITPSCSVPSHFL